MDGKEACQIIREYEKKYAILPSIIIMVSGTYSEREARKLLSEGTIDLFLTKPASFENITKFLSHKLNQFPLPPQTKF